MPAGRHQFLVLDGLRGVAALSVLWGHAYGYAGQGRGSSFELAVDFFFILSGFVIAHAYKARLDNGMRWTAFVRLRLIRLYPLMLLGILAGAVATALYLLVESDFEWWRFWASAGLALIALPSFLIPVWVMAFPLNGPTWSLSFEFLANFVYAAIAARLSQWQLIGLTLVSAAALIAATSYFGALDVGYDKATLTGGLARISFGFLCGLAINGAPRLRALPASAGILTMAVLGAVLFAPVTQPLALELAFVLVGFPLLIQVAASVEPSRIGARVYNLLGQISYPLYVLHYPLIRVMNEAGRRLDPGRVWVWPIIVGELIVCVLASYCALKLFDEPIRRLLSKRGKPAPEASARAA